MGGKLDRISVADLKAKAKQGRIDIINMLAIAGSGHSGGSLSCIDILTVLYFCEMKHKPGEPLWEGRDIFVLSKGHCCPALYSVLARSGYFPAEELMTLRKLGSRLDGHPSRAKGLPGIEVSSGSLGQGLSIANGVALAFKMDKNERRVYCLMGDGELQEGQIWEAAMTAPHYGLDNLCGIVDNNMLQIDGKIQDVKSPLPISDKWKSFGWNVIEIDGHDIRQIMDGFEKARCVKGKPSLILAHTVKGKGVSFMENRAEWHGVAPDEGQAKKALMEIEKS